MARTEEFSALVAAHGVWLSAFLRGLTRREADAEDAFQEVWMRVFKQGGLPKVSSPRAYLAQTARSVVIDRYRREGREELVLDEPNESGVAPAERLVDAAPLPDVRLGDASTREALRTAIRNLPEGPRTVVLMRIEAELSFQEIADELQIPLGTVLTWMRGATERLKRALRGER